MELLAYPGERIVSLYMLGPGRYLGNLVSSGFETPENKTNKKV